MVQTQRFENIQAIMVSAGNANHLDLIASFTHQHSLMQSAQSLLGSIPLESKDLLEGENTDKAIARIPKSVKDDVPYSRMSRNPSFHKQQRMVPFHSRKKLDDLKEEDFQEEENPSDTYATLRQTLSRAYLTQRWARNAASKQGSTGKQYTEELSNLISPGDDILSNEEEEFSNTKLRRRARSSSLHKRKVREKNKSQETQMTPNSTPKISKKRHHSERVSRQNMSELQQNVHKSRSLEDVKDNQHMSEEQVLPMHRTGTETTEEQQSINSPEDTGDQKNIPSPDVYTISQEPK